MPDKFKRRDVDCCVRLDPAQLLDADIPIYISAAGGALIPRDVPVEFIERLNLLKWPKLTLYTRPKQQHVDACDDEEVTCRNCGAQFRLGSWWCLRCWEPMTVAGIADRQTFLADDFERHRELRERYGLTAAEFEACREMPGSTFSRLTDIVGSVNERMA